MHDHFYITYLGLATIAYAILFVAHVCVRSHAFKQLTNDALEVCTITAYALLSIACGVAVSATLAFA